MKIINLSVIIVIIVIKTIIRFFDCDFFLNLNNLIIRKLYSATDSEPDKQLYATISIVEDFKKLSIQYACLEHNSEFLFLGDKKNW